jgi:hypothetical protein
VTTVTVVVSGTLTEGTPYASIMPTMSCLYIALLIETTLSLAVACITKITVNRSGLPLSLLTCLTAQVIYFYQYTTTYVVILTTLVII